MSPHPTFYVDLRSNQILMVKLYSLSMFPVPEEVSFIFFPIAKTLPFVFLEFSPNYTSGDHMFSAALSWAAENTHGVYKSLGKVCLACFVTSKVVEFSSH